MNSPKFETIFYCDDDADDLFLFTDIVKDIDSSVECITVLESEAALQMLSGGTIKPDIIFLDINIPKMSGIEILAWLRRQHSFTDIPIIMYSTSVNDRETKYCKELGAAHVLPKLFNIQESVNQIKKVLSDYFPDSIKESKSA